MKRKGALPNRKPEPMAIGDPVFEDGELVGRQVGTRQAARLASEHGFRDGFDLHHALENAFDWFLLAQEKQRRGERQGEQTDFLKALVERSALLEDCMEKMSLDVTFKVYNAWPNASTQEGALQRIEQDSRSLHWAAKRALAKHKDGIQAGRPKDYAFLPLLDALIGIYEHGTGQEPGLTMRHDGKGPWDGPLFRFVQDCLAAIGVKKLDNALGKSLERRLKHYGTKVS
jgi:hypothetical protein